MTKCRCKNKWVYCLISTSKHAVQRYCTKCGIIQCWNAQIEKWKSAGKLEDDLIIKVL